MISPTGPHGVRVLQQPSQRRLFGRSALPQPLFGVPCELRVMFARRHHAERGVAVRERNQPGPDVVFVGMDCRRGSSAGRSRRPRCCRCTCAKTRRAAGKSEGRSSSSSCGSVRPKPLASSTNAARCVVDFVSRGSAVTAGRSPPNIDGGDLHLVADRPHPAPRRFVGEHLVELARAAPGT